MLCHMCVGSVILDFRHPIARMQVNHDMFEGRPFRGSLEFLKWYVDIAVHCTALLIRTETTRQLPGWPDDGVGHPHRPI